MGKTFSTGLLTNGIWQDASNNIGIGGSPSGSYKLEVTGTLRNTTSAYFATTSGSVGIGTTSPSYTLDVYAASGYAARLNGPTYGGLILANAGTANSYFVGESTLLSIEHIAAINIRTNNADRVRILSNGNVGIATTAPDARLTVVGASGLSTGYGNFLVKNTLETGISLGAYSNLYTWIQGNVFGSGTATISINPSGGNVNIGDTNGFSDTRFYIKAQGTTSSTYAIVTKQSNGSTDLFVIRDDGYGFLKAAAWAYGSDRRIKENINYIQTGLDKILALKPATFDYIDGVKNNIGWIAQDVQEVIPEAVNTISEINDQLTLKSDYIVPYLVKAVQELSQQNQDLKSRLDKAGL